VLRASVPEAPVDEDRDPLSGKDNISSPTAVKWERCIDSVSKASRVEPAPEAEFRACVHATVRGHRSPSANRRRMDLATTHSIKRSISATSS